jgi:hypothetical protein
MADLSPLSHAGAYLAKQSFSMLVHGLNSMLELT